MRDILTTADIAKLSGWTLQRIQRLCRSGQLPAKDISSGGKKARYVILRSEWEAFVRPDNAQAPAPAKKSSSRRARIDASVPKVFG